MQSTALQLPKASGLKAGRRASGCRQRRAPLRVAAAAGYEDTDLGALFRDAMSTPAVGSLKSKADKAASEVAAAAASKPAPSVTVDPVPGTELLRSAPPPQEPPAPSQGMDFVLEQLQAKPPGYGSAPAAPSVPNFAAKPIDIGDSLSDGAAAASKALGDAAGAAAGASKAASEAAAQAAAAAADAAAALKASLGGALPAATEGASASAQAFLEGAASELSTEVSIIRGNIEAAVGGVQAAIDGAVGGVSSAVGGAVGGVASQVGGAAGAAYSQLSGLLPPEAQEALSTAGAAVSAVAQQVSGVDGSTTAAVAGLGLGLPALAAWKAAYGGYSGTLSAEEALELLQSQDALLLDVRTEAARVAGGTPELRRGALGKGAAVPPVRLLPSVARRVRDPAGVALEIQALEAAALSKLSRGSTKVVVMDERGEQAKAVARALRAVGVRRAYVLTGGFKAWSAAGLGVRQAAEYDASPLLAVGDAAESVVEQAASQLSGLRQPRAAVTAAALLGGGAFLAVNFHSTLQFVGVLGLELTLASRALNYSSPQDALDDLAGLWNGLSNLAALPTTTLAAFQAKQGGGGGGEGAQQAAAAGKSEARV